MVSNINQPHRSHGHLPNPSPADGFQFDPWLLWVTFRRCWPWAVPIGAVLAAVSAFWVLESFVPRYRASHLLEANDDYIVFRGVTPTVRNLAGSEKGFFTNPIVLDRVLDDPALRSAPSLSDPSRAEGNLRANLSIGYAGSAGRMTVSYTDTDPVAAAEVCNAIVASYLLRREEFDNTRVNDLERWLSPEIQNWEHEVEERQARVHDLSKTLFGFTPGERVSVIEDKSHLALLTDLRGQITNLEVELTLFDAKQKIREDDGPPLDVVEFIPPPISVRRNDPTETDIAAMIAKDPAVQEAKGMVAYYRNSLFQMEEGDTVRIHRELYEEKKAKRDEWAAKLESAQEAARPPVTEMLNARADEDFQLRKQEADAKLAMGKKEFEAEQKAKRQEAQRARDGRVADTMAEQESLKKRLDRLKEIYDQERASMEKFGGDSAELQFANDDLVVASEVLGLLRSRVAAIRTERQKDGSVRTLAPAVPPKTPVETIPMKKLLMTSCAVFLAPFVIGLLWEFNVQRVTDSAAMEKSNKLVPVVGEIARLPSGTGKGRRLFAESIDTLRANLFISSDNRNLRTITVASSMSGEGKSSVASQLAISIAKATGETVLLVDADLRCPDQHDIFGLEMGPGLSGVISGNASLGEAVDKSLGDLVHVLPAGRLTNSPHRLINPESIRGLMDQSLESYAYVVVDTAPVLSAGETLAVASATDATLLCVLRDVSRMDSVTKTTHRLSAAGANLAGTVFSGVASRKYTYRYGDYHYALAGQTEV